MEEPLSNCRLVLMKDGKDEIVFKPTQEKKCIYVGEDIQCDIRIVNEDVARKHFVICIGSSGKIKLKNLCSAKPVIVNNEPVVDKRFLKSGDIIDLFGRQMKWESNAEARRRTAFLTKSERKAKKQSCLTTRSRITIHKLQNLPPSTVQSDSEPSSKDQNSTIESPKKEDEVKDLASFNTPKRNEKENLSESFQAKSLNLSGTLLTSYTPNTIKSSSRTRITPKRFNTSTASSIYTTPGKSILKETISNNLSFSTPDGKGKKSMHLIDLTTPQPRKQSTSTPTQSSSKKTSTKTTTRSENVLLKSAIKNSTLKKVEATPNKKLLSFLEPMEESPTTSSGFSSVIEVSSVSETFTGGLSVQKLDPTRPIHIKSETVEEEEKLKTPVKTNERSSIGFTNYTGVGTLLNTPGSDDKEQTSDDEFQDLLDNISSVLDSKDIANVSDESLDKAAVNENPSLDVLELNQLPISQSDESVAKQQQDFDALHCSNEIDADKQFDNLTKEPASKEQSTAEVSQTEVDENKLKKHKILDWIAVTRNSMNNEPNQTEQVLSSRYSNVTPNDSVSNAGPSSTPYDPAKAKVSILHAVDHLRKNGEEASASKEKKLAITPVSRLSVSKNDTVIVENYKVSPSVGEMPKSMRSTRKRFGKALASLNDTSQAADTTIDPNETMNVSIDEARPDLDQSKTESVNILSLDAPQQSEEATEQQEIFDQDTVQSIAFYQFGSDAVTQDIFEISSSDNDDDEVQSQSDDEDEESSEAEESSESDEIEEIEDESFTIKDGSPMKFPLTDMDLEEGVNPLENSITASEIQDGSQEVLQKELEEKVATDKLKEADVDASTAENVTSSQLQEVTDEKEEIDIQETKTLEDVEEISPSQSHEFSIAICVSDPTIETTHKSGQEDSDESEDVEEITSSQSQELSVVMVSNKDIDNGTGDIDMQNDDSIDIPATQDFFNASKHVSDPEDDIEVSATQAFEDTEIPATQAFEDSTIDSQVDNEFPCKEATDNDKDETLGNVSGQPNESDLFSDTEFSRVDINPELLVNETAEELKGLSDNPTVNKRAASLILTPIDAQIRISRKTLAIPADEAASEVSGESLKRQQELANIIDKPVTSKRDDSISSEQPENVMTARKTLVPIPYGQDLELSVQHDEINEQVVNVQDQSAAIQREASLTPEKSEKVVASLKTLAAAKPDDSSLSESFVQHIEIQKELMNVKENPSIERRGASLAPKQITKETVTRKTLAPGAAPDCDELSESFIKHVEIQKELFDIHDEPVATNLEASVSLNRCVKVVASRKTLALTTVDPNEILSDSSVQHIELQEEIANVQENSTVERSEACDSPKTSLDVKEKMSETFIQQAKNQQELVHAQDQPDVTEISPEQVEVVDAEKSLATVDPDETFCDLVVIENQKVEDSRKHLESDAERQDVETKADDNQDGPIVAQEELNSAFEQVESTEVTAKVTPSSPQLPTSEEKVVIKNEPVTATKIHSKRKASEPVTPATPSTRFCNRNIQKSLKFANPEEAVKTLPEEEMPVEDLSKETTVETAEEETKEEVLSEKARVEDLVEKVSEEAPAEETPVEAPAHEMKAEALAEQTSVKARQKLASSIKDLSSSTSELLPNFNEQKSAVTSPKARKGESKTTDPTTEPTETQEEIKMTTETSVKVREDDKKTQNDPEPTENEPEEEIAAAKITKRARGGRTKKQTEIIEISSQEEAATAATTPMATPSRARRANSRKPAEVPMPDILENDTPTVISTRTRRGTSKKPDALGPVEPSTEDEKEAKKTTSVKSRRPVDISVPTENITDEEPAATNSKRARGKTEKLAKLSKPVDDSSQEETEAPKEAEPVKGQRANKRPVDVSEPTENESDDKEAPEATKNKKARGRYTRKPAVSTKPADNPSQEDAEVASTQVKSRRGKSKKTEEIPEPVELEEEASKSNATRARRGNAKKPAPVESVNDSAQEEEEAAAPAPKVKGRRGNKRQVEVPELDEEAPPAKTGKRAAAQSIEESSLDVTPAKGRRGNKKVVVETKAKPEEEIPSAISTRALRGNSRKPEEASENTAPVKKTRGAPKQSEEDAAGSTSKKPTRGRQKKVEEEVPMRTIRETRSTTVEPRPVQAQTVTPAKRAAATKKKVTIVTPSTEAAKTVEAPKAPRTTRVHSESEVEEPAQDVKRSMRSRKLPQKFQ